MNIVKRSGAIERLTKKKIHDSIVKANNGVSEQERLTDRQIKRITDSVVSEIELWVAEKCGTEHEKAELSRPVPIDKLEDMIENKIMENSGYEVAKAYITYRYEKEKARNLKTLSDKLFAKDVVNQNANIDEHSFTGRIGEATSAMMKSFALDNLISEKSKMNHINNEIYIHDLDHYAVGDHNCLSIPFDKLLAEGFNTRQVDIRPAQSVNTAFQLVAVIFQLQSLQQFGGVSATHLDWTMVPYVRKSFYKHYADGCRFLAKRPFEEIEEIKKHCKENDLCVIDPFFRKYREAQDYAFAKTIEELMQAVEGMYHNLNSLQSRSGGQVPFTSINYGTCTLPEGQMVIQALLDMSKKGLGKFHRTSIFPCGIFQLAKGINRKPGDPNYHYFIQALESTSKRLYPNYANVDWSGNAGYDKNDPKTFFSTMGCRTANGLDINAEEGVNPQTKDGRGNICPVTVIMPTLAMEAVENTKNHFHNEFEKNKTVPDDRLYDKYLINEFFKILDTKIHEAKDMLLERFDWICSQPPDSSKFMYENGVMLGYHPEEGIRSALKHGTLVIGQLGLAETLQILIKTDHTTENGMNLAKRIEQLFKDRCAEFKKRYKLNFGVYYTPAENLCKTAMIKFKEKYGVIENVSDKDYFTNSMHVPVWRKMNPFEKIDIESQLTGYSNAGCITYVECDASTSNNIPALETLVNYAMDHDIPYFAINIPSDLCETCGYQGEINGACPSCGGTKIQRLRRVTGYLTGDYKTAFNSGKQQEVEMRVKHNGICIDA